MVYLELERQTYLKLVRTFFAVKSLVRGVIGGIYEYDVTFYCGYYGTNLV